MDSDSVTRIEAVGALVALGDPVKAAQMAAYHKASRRYLGVANPAIDQLVRGWRRQLAPGDWADLAAELWDTDIHEAMIAGAKLIDRVRYPEPDEPVWSLVCRWVDSFDAWAVADHATIAGQKRLVAHPERIEDVAGWTTHPNMWTRRAALVVTLPYARAKAPSAAEAGIRRQVLGWAAGYLDDREWFIHKAVAWWIRDLSKADPAAAGRFVADHAAEMRTFARREATKYLG